MEGRRARLDRPSYQGGASDATVLCRRPVPRPDCIDCLRNACLGRHGIRRSDLWRVARPTECREEAVAIGLHERPEHLPQPATAGTQRPPRPIVGHRKGDLCVDGQLLQGQSSQASGRGRVQALRRTEGGAPMKAT